MSKCINQLLLKNLELFEILIRNIGILLNHNLSKESTNTGPIIKIQEKNEPLKKA